MSQLSSNHAERAIVYLYSEMFAINKEQLQDRVLSYVELSELTEKVQYANLFYFSREERNVVIDAAFENIDMKLLIIDGLDDFIASLNSQSDLNQLEDKLVLLAIKHHTRVLTIIHEKEGSKNVRGYLGTNSRFRKIN